MLALPHLGNWDFAGAWLARRGYTVTVVAEPLEPPELFEWFVETRGQLGMRVIPLSPHAGTEVLHAVRANEVVCLLCDRDLTGDGHRGRVLRRAHHAARRAGDARAARRRAADSGRVLLPCRTGATRPTSCPPIPAERGGRIRDDLTRVTQDLAHRFEELIRVAPEHWHLLQPNWPSDRDPEPHPDRADTGSGMR